MSGFTTHAHHFKEIGQLENIGHRFLTQSLNNAIDVKCILQSMGIDRVFSSSLDLSQQPPPSLQSNTNPSAFASIAGRTVPYLGVFRWIFVLQCRSLRNRRVSVRSPRHARTSSTDRRDGSVQRPVSGNGMTSYRTMYVVRYDIV